MGRGRTSIIAFLLVSGLLVSAGFLVPGSVGADPVVDNEESAALNKINEYRHQNGLASLSLSRRLSNSADWLSTDMAQYNYFSHTDRLGRNFSQRANAYGYPYASAEILAAGSATGADTFQQWRTSTQGHNEIMLAAGARAVGIGRAYNPNSMYGWYWTAVFGSQVMNDDVPPTTGTTTTAPTTTTTRPPTTTTTRPPTTTPTSSTTTTTTVPPPPEQRAALVSAKSVKAMQAPAPPATPGSQLVQWGWTGALNQQWRLIPLGGDVYVIASVGTAMVLDVAGGSPADGAAIVQSPWDGRLSQWWRVVPFGGDAYVLVSMQSGKVVDVSKASMADGAPLLQWTWHGAANQIWVKVNL
jgi:hypothetical protein